MRSAACSAEGPSLSWSGATGRGAAVGRRPYRSARRSAADWTRSRARPIWVSERSTGSPSPAPAARPPGGSSVVASTVLRAARAAIIERRADRYRLRRSASCAPCSSRSSRIRCRSWYWAFVRRSSRASRSCTSASYPPVPAVSARALPALSAPAGPPIAGNGAPSAPIEPGAGSETSITRSVRSSSTIAWSGRGGSISGAGSVRSTGGTPSPPPGAATSSANRERAKS